MLRLHHDAPLQAGVEIELPEDAAHYVLQVMRLKAGEQALLFNAAHGEWLGELSVPRKKTARFTCLHQVRQAQPSLPVTLCFAPVKGGRTEAIIEKATELGVTHIRPVKTERTIITSVNIERLQLVAREAAEQCERFDVPTIHPLCPLSQLLGSWPDTMPLFYGDESGASGALAFSDQPRPQAWGVLVGPEGGFSPQEFHLLQRTQSAKGMAVGPRILRADTACYTLLAVTAHHFGDWHERPHFQPG